MRPADVYCLCDIVLRSSAVSREDLGVALSLGAVFPVHAAYMFRNSVSVGTRFVNVKAASYPGARSS